MQENATITLLFIIIINMLITIVIAVIAPFLTEAVTWLNSKLTGTVLNGYAAFVLAAVIALLGGTIKVFLLPILPANFIPTLLMYWSEILGASTIIFWGFIKLFGLDVKIPGTATTGTM